MKYHARVCRLFLAALVCALAAAPWAATAQEEPSHPKGLREPNAAERAWMDRHMVRTVDLTPGEIGLERIRADRRSRRLPDVTREQAARGLRARAARLAEAGAIGADAPASSPDGGDSSSSSTEVLAAGVSETGLPVAVDNSLLAAFPPVGDQVGPTCGAFSSTYYTTTHMVNLARGVSAKDPADKSTRMSVKFVYNFLNDGYSGTGSWFTFSLTQAIGCLSEAEWPWDSNATKWPLEASVYRKALKNRMGQAGTVTGLDTDAGLFNLKTLLNNGYVLNYATHIDSWKWTTVKDDPSTPNDDAQVGKAVCFWTGTNSSGHGMTVVGYNDDIWTDINANKVVDPGEKGALRVVNSWGTGWKDKGFSWISYDALNLVSAVPGAPSAGRTAAWWGAQAYWITARASYTPKLLAEVTLNTRDRDHILLQLGIGTTSQTDLPAAAWLNEPVLTYNGGPFSFAGTTVASDCTFAFDLTDLNPPVRTPKRYLLKLWDQQTDTVAAPTTIKAFRLTDAGGRVFAAAPGLPVVVNDSSIKTLWIDSDFPNVPPVAANQSVSASRNAAKAVTLSATDADGQALSYEIVSGPAHGTLSAVSGSQVTYTPEAGYAGDDAFTFRATDGIEFSGAATVSVTVLENSPPAASSLAVTTAEDTPAAIFLIASDPDGAPLTYSILSSPSHGTLSGTGANRTYTPAANYSGADSFTFQAGDGELSSNVATVSITVTAVNDVPVAYAQSVTTAEDTAKAVTLQATDVEDVALTYSIVQSPAHGAVSGTGANRTYKPAANFFGSDAFTFKVKDAAGAYSSIAVVSVTVTPVNDVPVAKTQSLSTLQNTPATITLVATDADGDAMTYRIAATPLHGTLSAVSGARVTYTPAAGTYGSDSFTFTASDGKSTSAAAKVSLSVRRP